LFFTQVNGENRFDGGTEAFFHPGIPYFACRLDGIAVRTAATPWEINNVPLMSALIRVKFRVGAEGARPIAGLIEIPGRDVLRAMNL
jgi:hypothetical protein